MNRDDDPPCSAPASHAAGASVQKSDDRARWNSPEEEGEKEQRKQKSDAAVLNLYSYRTNSVTTAVDGSADKHKAEQCCDAPPINLGTVVSLIPFSSSRDPQRRQSDCSSNSCRSSRATSSTSVESEGARGMLLSATMAPEKQLQHDAAASATAASSPVKPTMHGLCISHAGSNDYPEPICREQRRRVTAPPSSSQSLGSPSVLDSTPPPQRMAALKERRYGRGTAATPQRNAITTTSSNSSIASASVAQRCGSSGVASSERGLASCATVATVVAVLADDFKEAVSPAQPIGSAAGGTNDKEEDSSVVPSVNSLDATAVRGRSSPLMRHRQAPRGLSYDNDGYAIPPSPGVTSSLHWTPVDSRDGLREKSFSPSPQLCLHPSSRMRHYPAQTYADDADRLLAEKAADLPAHRNQQQPAPPSFPPTHPSVFYPHGLEGLPPILLHYITIGGWRTVAPGKDYYHHRRLRGGEVLGHTVRWMQNAKPRDRFVFFVWPVSPEKSEGKEEEAEEEGCGWPDGSCNSSSMRSCGAIRRSIYHLKSSLTAARRRSSAVLVQLREKVFGELPLFARFTCAAASQRMSLSSAASDDGATPTRNGPANISNSNSSIVHLLSSDSFVSSVVSHGAAQTPMSVANDSSAYSLGDGALNTSCSLSQCSSSFPAVPRVSSQKRVSRRQLESPAMGVEVVEVAHADITAMDHAARFTSSRLSIEAKGVYTYFFPSLEEALGYYECEGELVKMAAQVDAGITSQIPCRKSLSTTTQNDQCPRSPSGVGGSSSGYFDPSLHSPKLAALPSMSPASTAAEALRSQCSEEMPLTRLLDFPHTSPLRRDSSFASGQQRERQNPLRALLPGSLSDALRSAPGGFATSPPATAAAPSSSASFPPSPVTPQNLRTPLRQLIQNHKAQPSSLEEEEDAEKGGERRPTPPQKLLELDSSSDWSSSVAQGTATYHSTPRSSQAEAANVFVARSKAHPRLISSHCDTVVSIYTADPALSSILHEMLVPEPKTHVYTISVSEQKRLLSMVEIGMPPWTVFYAATGLPYRRLIRLLYSGSVNLWPLLSLAVGLYDLYKHLPQLRSFMKHTLDPLTRWIEQRVTLQFSVLLTYLFSVFVTIFSSLGSFLAQLYVVQLFSLPLVQLVFALVKLPFVVAFDTVWTAGSILYTILSLLLAMLRVVVMAPFVLVLNVESLQQAMSSTVPAAVEGTSITLRWWRAMQEFWFTVASPLKNAAKAWWDSMLHVGASAARREVTIRRWYASKLEGWFEALAVVQECAMVNGQLLWGDLILPGLARKLLLIVTTIYLYWLFLGISPELWGEVIDAAGGGRRGLSASLQLPSALSSSPAPPPPPPSMSADPTWRSWLQVSSANISSVFDAALTTPATRPTEGAAGGLALVQKEDRLLSLVAELLLPNFVLGLSYRSHLLVQRWWQLGKTKVMQRQQQLVGQGSQDRFSPPDRRPFHLYHGSMRRSRELQPYCPATPYRSNATEEALELQWQVAVVEGEALTTNCLPEPQHDGVTRCVASAFTGVAIPHFALGYDDGEGAPGGSERNSTAWSPDRYSLPGATKLMVWFAEDNTTGETGRSGVREVPVRPLLGSPANAVCTRRSFDLATGLLLLFLAFMFV